MVVRLNLFDQAELRVVRLINSHWSKLKQTKLNFIFFMLLKHRVFTFILIQLFLDYLSIIIFVLKVTVFVIW